MRRNATPALDPRARQLSSQAQEALSLALASTTDPRLEDASLVDVQPHPDATTLLVVVAAPSRAVPDVRAALADARPFLRREVAAEIHRKRAPELVFTVLPVDEVPT